jgi:hypothetical protein
MCPSGDDQNSLLRSDLVIEGVRLRPHVGIHAHAEVAAEQLRERLLVRWRGRVVQEGFAIDGGVHAAGDKVCDAISILTGR